MSFDPDTFMDQGTSEAGSTKFEPIPAGTYNAQIAKLEAKQITSKKTGENMVIVEVHYDLLDVDDALKQKLGKEKLSVRQSFFPDMMPTGGLDMSKGKNITLNKIRDAVGMNVAGKPFKMGMLNGAGPLSVVVTLRPDDKSDAIYNDVKTVGKAK